MRVKAAVTPGTEAAAAAVKKATREAANTHHAAVKVKEKAKAKSDDD